jgi:hypothetical protein
MAVPPVIIRQGGGRIEPDAVKATRMPQKSSNHAEFCCNLSLQV